MKKGLLSLLAVTLTMVGCQDYDDQFAELTGLVNGLSTEVAGLSAVNASVAALSTTVNGLSSALAGNTTTITTALAAAQADIDAIEALLANVTTADELAAVSAALAAVQADVTTLLEADAVINQNVVINNSATLEYVNSLIGSSVDDPNVIVNGSVTINTTTFTPAITAAQLAEVNAIAAKLATVLGAGASTEGVIVTSATPITFTNLSFIDDDYTISGADMDDAALRTVSGNLSASHGGTAVAFDYSQLASVGGNLVIAAADAATATSINLSGVVITGTFAEAGQFPGNLTFEGATSVDLGTAGFHKLTAAKASSIVSGMTTTGSLTITALNGGSIDINSLTEVTGVGVVELTGTSTSVFHLDGLTDADGTITSSAAGEVHLPSLTAHGAIDISATAAVALTSLVTTTAAIDLNTTPAAILTNFVEAAHTLTWNIGVINLPNVNLEVAMSTTATDVTIKSFDEIADFGASPNTVRKLVLTAQDVDVAGTDAVTDLSITAAAGADVDYASAGNFLVSVSVDGTTLNTFGTQTALNSIALANTSTNTIAADTAVSTVTLSGTLVSFTSDSTTLAEFNNTATFLDKPGNTDTPIKIHIHDALLTSIDLSSMEKVAIVDIQDNAGLTTVIAPTGATNLLTPNAGASFTIKGNSLTATYTNSTAAFAGDGINPATPYAEACIYSPSLASWLAYATAVLTTNATVTLDLDYSNPNSFSTDCTADTTDTHGGAGTVDTLAELQLFQATACGS
ncbi:MAG: hypothetical protein MUQ79_04220 [Flavobacteriaceae bacterium]|nr:hypothetical protein [Flavobacteriaceae bacterium]